MKGLIICFLWFGVIWFGITFARYYYYLLIKKEKSAKEIKDNGPFTKVSSD